LPVKVIWSTITSEAKNKKTKTKQNTTKKTKKTTKKQQQQKIRLLRQTK